MRVAVLSGGRSSEHEVSLSSGAAVRAGLAEAGHEVLDVRLERDGTWWFSGAEVELRAGRGLLEADCVFPVLHGPFGEDGTVQGLLEMLRVPYVGADTLAAALCMDKVLFKDVLAAAGVPQVRYAAARDGHVDRAAIDALGLPVFVKPARLGSSVGIVKVERAEEMDAALEQAFAHDPLVIVEALATGLEVECSVLGNAQAQASEPGEIVLAPNESGWYDYEAKYTPGGMQLQVPARISPAARDRVRALAVETFTRVGCSGLARVDFFVDGDEVLVNELNTMPGQTPTSVYAKLWAASGVPYPQLVSRLCELGVQRAAEVARYEH
jgi:D-alanine-D-alanine ligase